ncbi:hypothetical protein BN2475_750005 [Paraburkholderia ribeironis]|uniref:Uncharacterized protein n=1 Tax=Paraburkholderia ribeironis TaxID=1247936 RepID=A0A1N7SJA6_9BURK|nr:hypothetical protein BN2475_750005 [Paraburkholderia ribeironis]
MKIRKPCGASNGMNAPTYRVGHAKGGGPSRADGIKVPKRKIIEIFTGKPEGPNEVYDGRGGYREERKSLPSGGRKGIGGGPLFKYSRESHAMRTMGPLAHRDGSGHNVG